MPATRAPPPCHEGRFQNQRDVLGYAHAMVSNGFPPGVLMIDEGWAEACGVWDFHQGRVGDRHEEDHDGRHPPPHGAQNFRGSMTRCLMRLRSQVYVMWTRPSAAWITAG